MESPEKEKISGLRYLMATSQLLHSTQSTNIDLSVGSQTRNDFLDAVGSIVALNDNGLYSKDFAGEFDVKKDYGVGSNFFTTRLANSRSQDIRYPGRPASLLELKHEHVSILENVSQTLSQSYGIGNIKSELCVWLLRNEDFEISSNIISISESELAALFSSKLNQKYTPEVVAAITPDKTEIIGFIGGVGTPFFVTNKPDYSEIATISIVTEPEEPLSARVLENDLPDEDQTFNIVQQLLVRGTKGILFLGPPGTSKTWYVLKVALKIISGDEGRLERVQFHPVLYI